MQRADAQTDLSLYETHRHIVNFSCLGSYLNRQLTILTRNCEYNVGILLALRFESL